MWNILTTNFLSFVDSRQCIWREIVVVTVTVQQSPSIYAQTDAEKQIQALNHSYPTSDKCNVSKQIFMIHESTKAVAEMKIRKKMFVFSLHPICWCKAGVLQLSVVRAVNPPS